jgi:DNA-binding transcriptional LysR family regulator
MTLAKSASLRQIVAFRTVARLGSVSFAAEELHLSQSAVSIQISNLEAAAGTALITRTGRGVRLTEAGELLLVYADRLLALWNETSDEIATLLGDFTGTLRVGSVTTADHWLPRLLVRFVDEHPKVKVKLCVANRDEVVRALAAREVDLAVMGRPPGELSVESQVIGRNPLAFVSAPDHPLMRVRDLTLARVAEVPLLVRERGSGTRTSVETRLKQAGLRLHIGSELSSNEAIKQMCVAGFGPAYVSLLTCALELDAGLLKVLPMDDNPTDGAWHVARLAGHALPKVALAFEQFLRLQGPTEILAPIRPHLVKAMRRRPSTKAAATA